MEGMSIIEIGSALLSMMVGLICFLFKRSLNDMDKKTEKHEEAIAGTKEELAEVKTELNSFKIDIAKDYVTKEDFNETTGQIMKKLDKIMDLIMEMNKSGGRYENRT